MRKRDTFRVVFLTLLAVLLAISAASAVASSSGPTSTHMLIPQGPRVTDSNGGSLPTIRGLNQPTAVEISVFATAPAAPRFSRMELVSAGILVLSIGGLCLLRIRRV